MSRYSGFTSASPGARGTNVESRWMALGGAGLEEVYAGTVAQMPLQPVDPESVGRVAELGEQISAAAGELSGVNHRLVLGEHIADVLARRGHPVVWVI